MLLIAYEQAIGGCTALGHLEALSSSIRFFQPTPCVSGCSLSLGGGVQVEPDDSRGWVLGGGALLVLPLVVGRPRHHATLLCVVVGRTL